MLTRRENIKEGLESTQDSRPFYSVLLLNRRAAVFLEDDVVGAALDDGGGGNQGDLGVLLQFGDTQRAAVAHGGLDLAEGLADVVLEAAGVGHVGIHALLEGQLLAAAEIVALPVARAVGALAPVLFHERAVDVDLVRRALVEAGEVAARS